MNTASKVEKNNEAYIKADSTLRAVLVGKRHDPDRAMLEAFGRKYTDYRKKWEAAGRFELEPDWPLHLDVDTNYSCNLKCIMCPQGTTGFPVEYGLKNLDLELYRRVIEEGAPRDLASVRLGITGEPLMRQDIFDFIDIAADAGIVDIMLITNGLLLTDNIAGRLVESGLTRLQVSLDAFSDETYRIIRPGGDLSLVVKNVLNFLDHRNSLNQKLPLLRVSFVKMRQNISEMEAFKEFWDEKADYISFQEYANILEKRDTEFFSSVRPKVKNFKCPDPWQRMSLFVNGDLFPCCSDFGRLDPIGNISDQSVEQAWKSDRARELRKLHIEGRWRDNPVCRRCAASSTDVEVCG